MYWSLELDILKQGQALHKQDRDRKNHKDTEIMKVLLKYQISFIFFLSIDL